MSNPITFVTGLYDINRESNGDGRKFEQYLSWFKDTLKIQRPMVVFVEESLVSFVKEHRGDLPTKIISQELEEIPYFYLNDEIKRIISSDEYRNKMSCITRLECNLSLYNVVIYSKFLWVKQAIQDNPFESDYFMWIDAGLSRFFPQHEVNIGEIYPTENALETLLETKESVLIQTSMSYYPDIVNAEKCDENYFWDARTWVMAGLWGGGSKILDQFCDIINHIFLEKMLKNSIINNEQNAMAYAYKNNEDMFIAFKNYSHIHRQYELIAELAK